MPSNPNIPPPNTPFLMQGSGGSLVVNPAWYRFLSQLNVTANTAQAGEVLAGPGLTGGGFVANGVELSIADGAITNALLRPSVALSVVGRAFGTDGPVDDIEADADNRVLSRESGQLAFRDFINGVAIGLTTPAPSVTTDVLELTDAAVASTATVTHSVPITCDGVVFNILLSTTP